MKRRLNDARVELGHRWRFAEKHRFVDRSTGSDRLLVVLAGHKPLLWPLTLERFRRALPDGVDACLVTPGVDRPELDAWARDAGWSYLTTGKGHVSVAQNLALRAHPRARWIYKLDEDIFVADGYFEALAAGYARVQAEADFAVGFCSPLLNVNGFSYKDFLEVVGATDAYRERFGALRRASDGIPAQQDGDAAVFLWERSIPVDAVAAQVAARPFGYSIVPHRFSIGALLFERDLWEGMRGFRRLERAPGLGEDEQHVCVECLSRSRIMAVLDDVYAGHFAFGPQMPAMERAFGHRLDEL